MEVYKNNSGESGITEYECEEDSIIVKFQGKTKYLYTYQSAGSENIEHMKKLAKAGSGLSTFISQVVKKQFAAKGDDIINNNPLKDMQIFLSYSWDDKNLADSLEKLFATRGMDLIRDTTNLQYKDSIKDFMKKIRKTDYVLLLISKSYLESLNCMYEIAELVKDENYKDRILPIVKENTEIFKPTDRTKYIVFWQDKFEELKNQSDILEDLNKVKILEELKKIERIKRDLPDFMEIISDMKIQTCNETIDDDKFIDIWDIVVQNASLKV